MQGFFRLIYTTEQFCILVFHYTPHTVLLCDNTRANEKRTYYVADSDNMLLRFCFHWPSLLVISTEHVEMMNSL